MIKKQKIKRNDVLQQHQEAIRYAKEVFSSLKHATKDDYCSRFIDRVIESIDGIISGELEYRIDYDKEDKIREDVREDYENDI